MGDDGTIIDPPLDGAAIGALRDALIAAAFDVNELYDVALTELDEDLFKTYGTRQTPLDALALNFLNGIKGRGLVARFLRAVRKRRAESAPLIAVIAHYCPSAMREEPPPGPQVKTLIEALTVLKERLANPDVGSIVRNSHDDLASLADGLARLRAYKGLHDLLQRFQVRQYPMLTECIRRLRTDPEASSTLRGLLLELNNDFLDKARESLRALEAEPVELEDETSWIDIFSSALTEIADARDRLDDRAAHLAARTLRDEVLRTEPTRINKAVRGQAKKLPLQILSDTIASAALAAGLDQAQRTALEEGMNSLSQLRLLLSRRVSEHNQWQRVEGQLWLLDGVIERSSAAIEEFSEYWGIGVECIAPLLDADVQAQWAVETQKARKAIDTAMAVNPADWQQVKSRYGDFRREALWQFFRVDGYLSKLCEEVLRIGAPVTMLLSGGK